MKLLEKQNNVEWNFQPGKLSEKGSKAEWHFPKREIKWNEFSEMKSKNNTFRQWKLNWIKLSER